MSDERWATLSIQDHRTALYRRALLLFDRIVVPIPSGPFEDITADEISILSDQVAYLADNAAAVRFDWDPTMFQSWQESVMSESLALSLNRDPLYATRLQLVEQLTPLIPPDVNSVVAVPVYCDYHSYDAGAEELRHDVPEMVLLEVVMPRLPVPVNDTALASIVEFRQQEQFNGCHISFKEVAKEGIARNSQ